MRPGTHAHVDSIEAVAERLHDARAAAGLSQRQVAFPGCTAVYICRVEKGNRVPSLQVLRELARRLNVSEEWLTTGSGPKEPPLVIALDSARLNASIRKLSSGEYGLADLSTDDLAHAAESVERSTQREVALLAWSVLLERAERGEAEAEKQP